MGSRLLIVAMEDSIDLQRESLNKLIPESGSDDTSSSDEVNGLPTSSDDADDVSLINSEDLNSSLLKSDPGGTNKSDQTKNDETDSNDDQRIVLSGEVELEEVQETVKVYNNVKQALLEVETTDESQLILDKIKRDSQYSSDTECESRDADSELEDIQLEFRSKYPQLQIPYSDELCVKIIPYLDIVYDILSGVVTSMYYTRAKRAAMDSKKAFLSAEDFRNLDINLFTAGYFGLRRQLKVGNIIYEKFRDELARSKSPKIQWWGPIDFANYVLAPEVLVSFVLDTCQNKRSVQLTSRQDVYELFDNTTYYGNTVTDNEPLESWELSRKKRKYGPTNKQKTHKTRKKKS